MRRRYVHGKCINCRPAVYYRWYGPIPLRDARCRTCGAELRATAAAHDPSWRTDPARKPWSK